MTKRRLIVFAGKPGAGKSSIIKKISNGYRVVDVWDFHRPNLGSGGVPPKGKNILGYQAMYQHLATLHEPRIILELGTSNSDLNVRELSTLLPTYEIDILLCVASENTCLLRLKERGFLFDPETVPGRKEQMAKDFPNTFISELKQSPLRHHIISTEGDIDAVCQIIKERFQI